MKGLGPLLTCLALAACCAAGCTGSGGFEEAGRYTADDLHATLAVSETAIDTASRIAVRLRVTAPLAYEVTMPGVEAGFGEFHLHDIETIEPTVDRKDVVTREERYILEPFLAGQYEIPPLEIGYRTRPNAPQRTLECVPVPVTVAAVLPPAEETPALRDIAPVAAWPERRAPWAAPIAVLTVCLVAAAAYWRTRASRAMPETGPAPYEIARAELEALLAEGLHTRQEWNAFYTRLTGILRRYIDRRFGIRAPKLTSRELIARVGETASLPPHDQALLGEFLDLGDMVKFARRAPDADAANESVAQCETILRDTADAGRRH